jgi:plastocyanin
MRHIKRVLIISVLIGLPIASHATDVAPKTRAQVRAELIAAELSGQLPYSKVHYPDPQPNPAVVYVARKAASDTSYGSSISGESAEGAGSVGTGLAAKRPTVTASAQSASDSLVTIKNFMFSPMVTTIKAGTTITWKNLDAEPHTIVSDEGIDTGFFHSYALDQGETFSYKFDKPGVYKVFSGTHPDMKETITVQ